MTDTTQESAGFIGMMAEKAIVSVIRSHYKATNSRAWFLSEQWRYETRGKPVTETAVALAHMIDCQLRPNEVNDERILDAIAAVPRESFVPKAKRSVAYVDEDIEVGEGRFLLEPRVFARMLVAADVQAGDIVLDIGCATGYSSAVLAQLAEAIVAVEENETLAGQAEKKLADQEVMNVAVVTCTMCDGVAKQGPYDVIFVEGAVEEIPAGLIKQLKEGGRLVCVKLEGGVGRAHIIRKSGGEVTGQNLFDANVMTLPGFEKKQG